jgi:hypothetical protein
MVDQRSLPNSSEGKARSGRNAEKPGMYSNAIVAILRDSYYRRFQPEIDLVDQMVAQRAGLDATYQELDPATRTYFAFDKLDVDSGALDTCQRFQAAQIRHSYKARETGSRH